ncbi:hypothetical protein ABZ419_26450 [Streptomyces cinnamoneus]
MFLARRIAESHADVIARAVLPALGLPERGVDWPVPYCPPPGHAPR